jgi:SAM-dependent MidA family methyltransferase
MARDAKARAGTRVIAERIAALIRAQGPIPVCEFMGIANGAYYAARDPLGRDFITAPEISQAFGELLGLWCVQVWHDQGRPKNTRLVELGPGRGTLMADALRAARVVPEFLEHIEIVLVETSPALRAVQRERLKDHSVRWSERFESGDGPLLLLANEFFDALPIRQFVRTVKGWRERMVTFDGTLGFALSPVPVPDTQIPPGRDNAPDGAVCEICMPAQSLVAEIARAIEVQGGAALIVDYGYDHPDFGETLQAVAGNAFTAILDAPGAHDLSAHVDFRALARAASGAAVHGPVGQGVFLEDIGIAARIERLVQANPGAAETLHAALARLVDPDQMGTLFKVLALTPRGAPSPPGF